MGGSDCHEDTRRLVGVCLDESSIGRGNPDQEHERAAAIWDIVECNHFAIVGHNGGPYVLRISLVERKLVLEVCLESGAPVIVYLLSLAPFHRVIKDYALICESYYAAIRTASPSQIEAIDIGRRGVHDEASEILRERLSGKVEVDFVTARRLFTLLFALHWKG